jgi:AraC-like DNA-binding protein
VDPRELFVDDGDVLTSAGTAAGIDLCLHVVRTDHGADAAAALARRLVVPPRRADWQTGQRHMDRSLPEEIGADPLAEVVAWALEHLHEQFDVEALAARAYMSRRTFDRRFRSLTGSAPLQWLITQRVLQAQRLLETSDYSVDEVAGRCGFRSPVALRGHFRRQLGSSPASYRAAYRARRPQEDSDRAVPPPEVPPARRGGPGGGPGGGSASGAGHASAGGHGSGHGSAAGAGGGPGGGPGPGPAGPGGGSQVLAAPAKGDPDAYTTSARVPEQSGRPAPADGPPRGRLRAGRGLGAALPGPRDRP